MKNTTEDPIFDYRTHCMYALVFILSGDDGKGKGGCQEE